MKKSILIAAAMSVVVSGAAEARKLSLQNAFPKNLLLVGPSAEYFSDIVKSATNGEIEFEHFGQGELSPPTEIVDNVGNGSIDAGWSYGAFTAAKVPVANLFASIPYGPDAPKYLAWVYSGGGLELWREAYAPLNVVPMPCAVTLAESGGWYNKPIDKPEDFQGLKMRFSGIGGKILARLGVSAQAIPGSEIYTSMETGRLDASEFSFPEIDALLGFEKIAKYYYFPGWHQRAGFVELTINKDLWDSWTDAQRQAIDVACRATILEFYSRHSIRQADAMKKFEAAGVEIRQFSPETLAAIEQAADAVYAEESANDPLFKKVMESYRSFSDKYDYYQDRNSLN